MLLIEEMLKSRNVTYWLVTSAMSCNYTVSFGINRVFWFRFNFVLLYLAIIFMLTGMVPADEQDWVFSERDGREAGCVPRSGADAVLNIGSAFHGEELGGGRGTPENQKKSTIWWQVFYTTQTYCIKHEVHFKKRIFFSMYIWGSALTYTDKPQALVTVISVCLETDLINWTSHILVISVAVCAFYTNFSWGTRNMIILYHTRLQRVFFNPCVICLFSNRRHWNNWKSWSGKAETTT